MSIKADKKTVKCLDKGYVRLVDSMGSDLSVVNAARASFAKESEEFSDSDAKLLAFLARNGHTSPFRHAFATIEAKAPMMVARQWYTYIVGSDHTMDAWNEASRRYITMDTEFYIPSKEEWRSAPDNKKQGSGGPIDPWVGATFTQMLESYCEEGERLYSTAMENNIAPEIARLFIPAYGLYTQWRWSFSLQSLVHFLNQRLAHDAQSEITVYARAVYKLLQPIFPVTIKSMVEVPNV